MKIEDLPRPANYRRQMAKNGGYEMVPAYTAEEVLGILEGVEKDAERFLWWFSEASGAIDPEEYVKGLTDGWQINQWRAFIDAAIKKGQV